MANTLQEFEHFLLHLDWQVNKCTECLPGHVQDEILAEAKGLLSALRQPERSLPDGEGVTEELPQPDPKQVLERQVRMHPFSSYTYHPDEVLREIAVEFFKHFKELWKLKKDADKTHRVFDLLGVPECRFSNDANLRLSDRAVSLASSLDKKLASPTPEPAGGER